MIINIVYANNQSGQILQQNNNTSINNNLPSNKEVIAEFKTKTIGGNTQPKEYFGNTNTYLNRMIQCTKFKADKNDPACQQFDYSATFESFVNRNFNKDKVNEILNNINFNTNNNINNNLSHDTNNNTSSNINNKITNNIKKDKNANTSVVNNNVDNKNNINIPTGPNINIIILLILSNILIIYMIWKIAKITNKRNLTKS